MNAYVDAPTSITSTRVHAISLSRDANAVTVRSTSATVRMVSARRTPGIVAGGTLGSNRRANASAATPSVRFTAAVPHSEARIPTCSIK